MKTDLQLGNNYQFLTMWKRNHPTMTFHYCGIYCEISDKSIWLHHRLYKRTECIVKLKT